MKTNVYRNAPATRTRRADRGWAAKLRSGVLAAAAMALAAGNAEARPGLTAATQAWQDCLDLCPVASVAGPEAAAGWALGCTLAYDAVLLEKLARAWGLFAYAPRFDMRGNTYAENEAVIYATGDTVALRAGRWDGTSFLTGQGTATGVDFQVVDWPTFLASATFDSAPWQNIGPGTFNVSTNLWNATWDTTGFGSLDGYVLRANFHDSVLGDVPAPNVAIVPTPAGAAVLAGAGLMVLARRRRSRE